jgi:hypothetical protein
MVSTGSQEKRGLRQATATLYTPSRPTKASFLYNSSEFKRKKARFCTITGGFRQITDFDRLMSLDQWGLGFEVVREVPAWG